MISNYLPSQKKSGIDIFKSFDGPFDFYESGMFSSDVAAIYRPND